MWVFVLFFALIVENPFTDALLTYSLVFIPLPLFSLETVTGVWPSFFVHLGHSTFSGCFAAESYVFKKLFRL